MFKPQNGTSIALLLIIALSTLKAFWEDSPEYLDTGNRYRLVVWINNAYRLVYVRFIGTHAQYERLVGNKFSRAMRARIQDRYTNYLIAGGITIDIKPIKTDVDYRAALKEIESLMMAGPDSPEGEKLDVMVTLIMAYETKHFSMELPGRVEAIKFEMERKGLTVKDLEPMIGKSNRVYEIFNHKRALTLKMFWNLHEGLGIPAESLIKPLKAHA